MLIGIYFILKDIVFKGVTIKGIISFIITLLIVGWAFSLFGNSLTSSRRTSTAYSRGVRNFLGRAIVGIFTGLVYLLRFVFWITPRWVYRRMMNILNTALPTDRIARTTISVVTAIFSVIILI